MAGALDDLVVLEVGEGRPIACLGKILAELGAEVVKLEPACGDSMRQVYPLHKDGISNAFHLSSAGKKSIAIDLRKNGDHTLIERMNKVADIVIIGDPNDVSCALEKAKSQPRTINCHLTAFGLNPLDGSHASSDGVMQAVSGIMATTGFPDGPEYRAGCNLADSVAALYAAIGVLAALHDRDITGSGQELDISICDCLMTFLLLWLPSYFIDGKASARKGNRHLSSVPWNTYPASDGTIMICTSTDQQWYRLAELLGHPDLGLGSRFEHLPGRMNESELIDQLVTKWTEEHTVEETVIAFEDIGIPVGRIASVSQVLASPQAQARQCTIKVADNCGGTVRVAGPLAKLSKTPGSIEGCGPQLNADRGRIESLLPTWEARIHPELTAPTRTDALGDLTVVESGAFGAGPFAGKLLAELGAKVIKLESPTGDGLRHYQPIYGGTSYPFHLYNAGKGSIALDLKSDSAQVEVQRLLATADIYLENLGPGVVERLGLDYESVAKRKPDIVYCSVSGYGRTGPDADRRAYDTVIQAESGIMSLTGAPGKPTKIGVSAADLIGPTFACVGILAAIHYRTREGIGQRIDASMFDACVWMTQSVWPAAESGESVEALGNGHPLYAPYGVFAARDDQIFIGIETDTQWTNLCKIIGIPPNSDLETNWDRVRQRTYIEDLTAQWVSEQSADEVISTCQAANIPAGIVCSIEAVMTRARTRERHMLVETRDLNGLPLFLTGSPFKLSRTPGRITGPAPNLGQQDGVCGCDPQAIGVTDSAILSIRDQLHAPTATRRGSTG